ncbi:MAG: hypothetical protein CSA45_01770 [Gammaproteobacteria bacterium]|nr:MAG: hypothetical protein CSA45_01770 [Gammaproteobacteria bacterium]
MNKKYLITGLFAVILFQLFVLVGEYANAVYPIWTGKAIKLKTVPVDPRSMFRGNYARLRYEISQIPGDSINHKKTPRNGEIVFVSLNIDKDGIASYNGASLEQPQQGYFIRGRIKNDSSRHKSSTYRVNYGIEAYFLPKEKALRLENRLRDNAIAVVMLADNGKATLKEVIEDK